MTPTIRPLRLLLAIVAAMFVTLAVDIYGALATASSTEALVDDALRGVYLVEDLRWQFHKLSAGEEPDEPTILSRIDADVAAYGPLASYKNEGAVWDQLRAELAPLHEEIRRGDHAAAARRAQRVSDLVEQLVAINVQSADSIAQHLSGLRLREIVIDVAVVLVIMVLLIRVGVSFNRTQQHEAELIARNLAMVQEQNRELEAFAGRAAHDLRVPLNPIRGFADLIATGRDSPDELRRMGGLISKGVMRMNRIIEDMLELSRSGRSTPGTANVRATAVTVLDELAAELRDADVELEIPELVVACRDSALEQILRNLVENSAKYREPSRRLAVAISARSEHGRAILEVEDNGMGMDEFAAEHAFDPFFRARPDVVGTGLGLAIIERIVRAYGGRCSLTSAPGSGTTVNVELPLAGA
jgi:signal transduction histidine kinase